MILKISYPSPLTDQCSYDCSFVLFGIHAFVFFCFLHYATPWPSAVKDRMQRIVSDVIVRAGGAAVITEAVQVWVARNYVLYLMGYVAMSLCGGSRNILSHLL